MSITKQIFTEIEFDNKTSLPLILEEIVQFKREYENDKVFIHQVLEIPSHKQNHMRYLLIINIVRNIENPGEKVFY